MRRRKSNKPVRIHLSRILNQWARRMGIYILAGRGSGKSRLCGRVLAWQDFRFGIPQVIIDPLGGTIDNFLDRVFRFLQYVPPEEHGKYWRRIRYIDMSGKSGDITPFPLYYKLGNERSLREVAERYLQVILKSNPSLLNAQVQGWPPLHKIGVFCGMALAGLELQITSAEDLLRHPEQYLSRLTSAQDRYPELAPVIAFFSDEYIPMRGGDRARLTNPFLDKIFPFSLDPYLKAMFGSNTPGIDWWEVEEQRQTVLLDFRDELDPELRRFKLNWTTSNILEHTKLRGRSPRPLAVLIDEIPALTQKVFSGENPIALELDEFINQYMRAHNVWFSCVHQELNQLDEQLRNTLLSLGTYIIGGTSSMDSARILADALFLRDPMRVKHVRRVWASSQINRQTHHFVIDEEPQFMPLIEQRELFAQRIKKLGLMEFLLRPALGEGSIGAAVYSLSIRHIDRHPITGEVAFPDQHILARLRCLLGAKSGKPLASLLPAQETDHALQEPRIAGELPAPDVDDLPINRRELLS
jgi:hypothetical protein